MDYPAPFVSAAAAQAGAGPMPSPAATVPSSSPITAQPPGFGGQLDTAMDALAKTIQQPIDPTKAYTPIPGAHAGAVPTSFQREVAPWQERGMDARRLVGRKASARQGVSNAITGVTNALGQVFTQMKQQKTDQLRDAATKVITAQQAIDEARTAREQLISVGGSQTEVQRYTEIIERNQQSRDAIFAGKLGKDLQKGFDISYTDPSSNKTDEHAAVQAAMKNAHTLAEKKAALQQQQQISTLQQPTMSRGQALGAAYEASQPQGVAQNTLAQQQYNAAVNQQKVNQNLFKDMMTMRAAVYKADTNVTVQQMKDIYNASLQQAKFRQEWDLQQEKFHEAGWLQRWKSDDNMNLAIAKANLAVSGQEKVWDYKGGGTFKNAYQQAITNVRNWQSSVEGANRSLSTLMTQRDKLMYDVNGKPLAQTKESQASLDDINRKISDATMAGDMFTKNFKASIETANSIGRGYGMAALADGTGSGFNPAGDDGSEQQPADGTSTADPNDLGSWATGQNVYATPSYPQASVITGPVRERGPGVR